MRRFLIKEENCLPTGQSEYAVLSYDEDTDEYHISIPPSVNPDDLPAIPGILARKGIREIDDRWARRFVKERVVPPDGARRMIFYRRDCGVVVYKIQKEEERDAQESRTFGSVEG